MERIYCETNEEKDFTDGTIKRRISSILKAPRTPLQDLGSGNELIQDCNIEKRQKNSRRVSFADTIRVFPPESQVTVELKHAETVGELRDQDLFNENEDPEVVSCEITGMNTLLHAPIQTSLQQTECSDAKTDQEWNKMNRTLIFSEENEMDMTSGHTYDIGIYQETDKTKKINLKSFSDDLKSEKEVSQINEFSFFGGPSKIKGTGLSQQMMNIENAPKIDFGDFLKSLKSVNKLPTGVPERNICSSEENVYSHLHEESCNTTSAFGALQNNRQNRIPSILSNETAVTLASKQLASGQENVGMIITNMESVLPPETSLLNAINSKENLWRDCSVNYNKNSGSRLKASRGQLGVQEDQSMCANEITVNHIEQIADKYIKIKKDDSLVYENGIMPVPIGSVTSMPILHADKTIAFSIFSADMELTKNCTDLSWEGNSKETGYPAHGDFVKERNNVSRLMEGTIFQEEDMDITNNQVSANSYLKSTQHSIFNERAVPTQEATYSKMDQNPGIQSGPQTSYLPKRKECNRHLGDEPSTGSVFFLNNSSLKSQVTKNSGSQAEHQFLSLSSDIMQQAHTTQGENKINIKSGLSNNALSSIPQDKTTTFHFRESMEITRPTAYLRNNSLSAAKFHTMPQQGMGSDNKNVTGSNCNKTVVFSLSKDHEMEINKSYTVPINYDMQQSKRTPQALSLLSMDEPLHVFNNDMDETKAIKGMIDQVMESHSDQAIQKQSNESERRTLTGSTKDRTVVFSFSDENELEITQSHTVALQHDAVTKDKDIPISSALPSNKTSMFTIGENMEISKPVEYVTEKSLKKLDDSCPMLDQNTGLGKKRVTGSANEKTGSALIESSDTKLTKSFTVPVEGTPQLLPLISEEKTSMSVHSGYMTMRKSTVFVPADKTMLFMHNNNMEITKPITYTSLKDTSVKGLQMEKEETSNVVLPERAKEETTVYLHEDNEIEITRSHTVTVNHDILQKVKVTPQGLVLGSAEKKHAFAHLSDVTIQSKTFVPADETFMYNSDMEITKPLSNAFLKNSCFTSLSQKGKEIRKTTLPGSNKDDTMVFSQCDAEMEITKCHSVAVTRGIVSQYERNLQELFFKDNMNTTGSHTISKENVYKSLIKPGKHAERELSPNKMVADETSVNKSHTITLNNKSDLPCEPTIQAKLPFPVGTTCTVTSYQDSIKANNFPPKTTHGGNLEESEKREMPNEDLKQSLNQVFLHTCDGKIQDVDVTKYHTVSIYGCNNDGPGAEKEILNSFTKSTEKTVVFSDGNNKEMTQNYTTGIEVMHMNGNNECHPNSEARFSTEIPALASVYGEKLDIAKPEKNPSDTSICPASVMLPVCLNTELEHQDYLKIKENQLELCTPNINNLEKGLTLDIVSNERNDFMFPTVDPILSKETTLGLNTEKMSILVSEMESLRNDPRKLSQSKQEASPSGETDVFPFDDKVRTKYEKELCEWAGITKDWQNNLESPTINTFSSEKKPVLLSELSGVYNSCQKFKDTEKKSGLVLLTQDVSNLEEALPKLTMKPDDLLSLKEDLKKELDIVASTEWTNTGFTEAASVNVPLNTMHTEGRNFKKLPLGIFPAKLPNKRKSTLSNVECTIARSEERRETQNSNVSLLIKRFSDKITQNSSPSCYINEELLPAYVEEMDSNESLSYDMPEKLYGVRIDKEITGDEGCRSEGFETNKRQRTSNQGDEELQTEKKFKVDESWSGVADLKQPLCSTVIAHNNGETQGKNVPELIPVNLEKTQSSNSSSLNSVKIDTDFSIQRNSEMETQFLEDSICEQNLREKLQEGTITVREFFTLLKVHILIQQPRQSQLPPKVSIWLKVHAGDQDKLLVNVHKRLWEVMRTCSDEELIGFGAELNKMKSCFTKKSKVLAHKGKTKLYAKLVQNAQLQWEKLQSRLAKMDELLKEMDGCIDDLETEAAALEESELDVNDVVSAYESKVKNTERELENLRVQEETLQRDQSNLRDKKQQIVSEIRQLQEYATNCQGVTEKYNFSEWVMKKWNDHQAVFTFLYDSIELVVALESPVDGAVYSNRIVSVNFESLLDEANALPSSKLVHRLIFQFIDSQSSWQEKCFTVHHLSQMLHEISLVVSRCQLLGEEIEFLNRWGGKFYLLKTEVNDTKVKFLFSSSIACSKFEVEIFLTANYPASPVAFAIQKCTGKLGQEEISAVLSSVPVGTNYLRRIVKQISHNLLQCAPSTIH
ncbi:kinetochore scaffold 1 [Sceloporus undulatus]|uniref:kinetochore scaffold 1 n=1 Tax=Sceloporus undulatus TaxID=8520 RepID=UPI001C4C0307|nr:kinetochore scaffold 1 [Sceloporus undulatus]